MTGGFLKEARYLFDVTFESRTWFLDQRWDTTVTCLIPISDRITRSQIVLVKSQIGHSICCTFISRSRHRLDVIAQKCRCRSRSSPCLHFSNHRSSWFAHPLAFLRKILKTTVILEQVIKKQPWLSRILFIRGCIDLPELIEPYVIFSSSKARDPTFPILDLL